jgi:protein-tyrosine phosphatase
VVRILFVCLGNICRSPLGEAVMRQRIAALGARGRHLETESAGTSNWHMGEPPDARAQAAAKRRGMDIGGQRGRQLRPEDFETFDYILAMDEANLAEARRIGDRLPAGRATARLSLLLDYAPHLGLREVPDPYWSGGDAFDEVIDMIEAAVDGLLTGIEQGAEGR